MFQFQYITYSVTKTVSQNKADAELSIFGRMRYNRHFAPLHIHFHEEVNVFTIDEELTNFKSNSL